MNAIEAKIQGLMAFRDNIVPSVEKILTGRSDEYLELQREQLFEGKASDGEDIRPYYSEDLQNRGGYFSSPQAAAAYANWKANEVSYPTFGNLKRNIDAPNLYITGEFHSQLALVVAGGRIEVIPTDKLSVEVMERYGADTFGLTEENLDKVRQEWILPVLLEELNSLLS